MATPQRNLPDEPRREAAQPELRRVDDRAVVAARRSNGLFWIWIVVFIAAIVWFCGWGFGGYGGWWWGRSPAVTQPYTAPGNAGGTGTSGGAAPAAHPGAGANGSNGANGSASTAPRQ